MYNSTNHLINYTISLSLFFVHRSTRTNNKKRMSWKQLILKCRMLRMNIPAFFLFLFHFFDLLFNKCVCVIFFRCCSFLPGMKELISIFQFKFFKLFSFSLYKIQHNASVDFWCLIYLCLWRMVKTGRQNCRLGKMINTAEGMCDERRL